MKRIEHIGVIIKTNEETNTKIVLENKTGWLIRYKGGNEHVYASAVGMEMSALIFPVSASEIVLGKGVDFARACHAYATLVERGLN